MKKIKNILILLFIFIICTILFSGCTSPAKTVKKEKNNLNKFNSENFELCNADEDCICKGIFPDKKMCYIGNKEFYEQHIDKKTPCPVDNFCEGPYGDMNIQCIDNKCMQMI